MIYRRSRPLARGRCPEGTEGVSEISKEVDQEIRAWLMIHAMSATKPGILGRKRLERELRGYLETLFNCDARSFAHRYITLCLSSRSYGSTLMNLVPLSEGQTAEKLRKEIDTVLRDYPAFFGLADACAPLRDVMLAELDSRRKT